VGALALGVAGGPAQAATKKKKAINATAVNGLRASKKPKPGQLVALDKNGKFPASVFPTGALQQLLTAGPQGAPGPAGPKGDTGTIDTTNFFTKADSDARFLAKGGKAVDAGALDGLDSGDFLQVSPAAAQAPAATPLGAPSLWLRPTVNYTGSSTYTSDFKLLNDGGLLTTGTLGVGQIPATGCGYRMMWHPFKAAFRAGSPGSCPNPATAWDDANTGFYSWAGGNQTTASAYGTFAYGDTSTASGVDSVAFGGSDISSGTASFTTGANNRASGFGSIGMGYNNAATGQGSVAIGYRVGALGDYSVALGPRAVTTDACSPASSTCDFASVPSGSWKTGSFVWGDESTTGFVNATANNQFTARAAGGFRLFTNASLTTGCTLPAGSGAFSCTSDRNAKRDFRPVDQLDVLKRLSRLPVTTWRYKSENGHVRHMGPTAQDFKAAFGLGTDDKHIGSIDEDGVNTAAIQALYALVQRQQRTLDAQAERIARLERRLAR
jgi:hypothetical protein